MIYIKNYDDIAVDFNEIYRYAKITPPTAELVQLVDECVTEVDISPRVCYGGFDITVTDNTVDFGAFKAISRDLAKNLRDCERAVIFCATIGIDADRLIKKYEVAKPSRAVILQAIATERIEALCNAFNNEIKERHKATPRFSAGYGDFDIAYQRDIFKVLTPERNIGVTLTDSLLMSPTKSVTAVIGIKGDI